MFAPDQSLALGRVNLVTAPNVMGKSALCEWLAAFGDLKHAWRWHGRHPTPCPVEIIVTYYDPEPHEASLVLGVDNSMAYALDGIELPLNPAPLHVVYPLSDQNIPVSEIDDVEYLSRVFQLPSSVVMNLAPLLGTRDDSPIENARFETREDNRQMLFCDVVGTVAGLGFRALSGSEQTLVVLEYAIEACRVLGRSRPTLLILDSWAARLDWILLEQYVGQLASIQLPFQTVAVIPREKSSKLRAFKRSGWEVIRLVRTDEGVVIDQSLD